VKLVGAVKDYFGKKPGQTLQEFAAEYRALSETDKAELTALSKEQGYDIEDS